MIRKVYQYSLRRTALTSAAAERLANNVYAKDASSVARMLRPVYEKVSPDREAFVVISLSIKNQVMGFEVVHIGHLTGVDVHPREVFKSAILNGAAGIILSHNHPSGDPTPSEEDIALTKRLAAGGTLLGIPIIDHVVVSTGGYISINDWCTSTK